MYNQPKTEEIDFEKYWLVLKRRWFPALAILSSAIALSALYTSRQIPIYQSSGKLLFKTNQSSTLTGVGNQNASQDFIALARNSDPSATQAEVLRSKAIAEDVVKKLDLRDPDGKLMDPGVVSGGLSASPVVGTDLLEVTYKSIDPELAAAVTNQVMKSYIENNIQTNRAEAAAAREFIITQLPEIETNVRKAEEALRRFKEANGVVVLETEANQAVAAIGDIDTKLTDAEVELASITSRSSELRNRIGFDTATSLDISALNQSAGVQDALKELQTVQAQLSAQRALYRDNHPAVAQLIRRESELQSLLQGRVGQVLGEGQDVPVGLLQVGTLKQELISQYVGTEIERISLIRRINQLTDALNIYEDRSSAMPALEKTQRELTRQLDAAQTTYETLLTKLQEVQVAENQNIGNARILAEATVPGSPSSPKLILNLIIGGFLGTMLAIVAAFLIDMTDRSVKTLKEARELFGYTLLGVIPYFGRNGIIRHDDSVPRIVLRDLPRSPIQESYQMIQANLKFLSSDKELKTIVVTSSVSGEGKSEVAANLAVAIAQLKRRVLLVDANMRHPVQHKAWDFTAPVGLSNLIVGQVKFSEAVQVVMPNLHVLPAGVIPPNSVALLDSSRMASLIKVFSSNYDFVVFDTPSLTGMADAAVLGKMTDGVLLVSRPGVVDAVSGSAAREFLKQSGQNVLGVVVNGLNIKNEPDSYFYYKEEQAAPKSDRIEAASEVTANR